MQEDEASLYPQSFCEPQVSNLVPVSWWKSLKRFSKTSKIQNLAVMIHLLSCSASGMSLFKLQTDLHEAGKSAWHGPCSRTCFATDCCTAAQQKMTIDHTDSLNTTLCSEKNTHSHFLSYLHE